jgi:hypothetical protein
MCYASLTKLYLPTNFGHRAVNKTIYLLLKKKNCLGLPNHPIVVFWGWSTISMSLRVGLTTSNGQALTVDFEGG